MIKHDNIDFADIYEKMGQVTFDNAVRTSELPPHIQKALKNIQKLKHRQNLCNP